VHTDVRHGHDRAVGGSSLPSGVVRGPVFVPSHTDSSTTVVPSATTVRGMARLSGNGPALSAQKSSTPWWPLRVEPGATISQSSA
jgi:hypothetical protein